MDKLYTKKVLIPVDVEGTVINIEFHSLNLLSAFFTTELFLLKHLSKDKEKLLKYKSSEVEEKLEILQEFITTDQDIFLSTISNIIFEYTNFAKIKKVLEEHCLEDIDFTILKEKYFLTIFAEFLLASLSPLNLTYQQDIKST